MTRDTPFEAQCMLRHATKTTFNLGGKAENLIEF